jgi:16S rRNA (adenine1518-N6/adenine1519-N6)-dimethyltransferase
MGQCRTLERVTEAAFGQRRKMLRQSLKGLPGALDALETLGIDPQRRAETLDVADFAIARIMGGKTTGGSCAPPVGVT